MSGTEVERYLKTALAARSRREAVRALADRLPGGNRSRLCRRLHALLETGEGPTALVDAVRGVLDPPWRRGFDESIREATLQRRAREESAAFALRIVEQVRIGPHLWVEHARRRPTQITIVAMTGLDRWKRVRLPQDFPHADWEEQVELIEGFWEYWLHEHGARCPLFGRVTGFFYRPNPWSSYRFTAEGRLCSGNLGVWQAPIAKWHV